MDRYAKKIATMVEFARTLRGLSTCLHRPAGAVVFSTECDMVAAIGYSGPVVGAPNDGCSATDGCECAHAEVNALLRLDSRSAGPCVLATTSLPCAACIRGIINSRAIIGCVIDTPHRDPESARRLIDAGIPTIPAGVLGSDIPGVAAALRGWRKA